MRNIPLLIAFAGLSMSLESAFAASDPYTYDPANVAITNGTIDGASLGQNSPIAHINVGSSSTHTGLVSGTTGIFGQPYFYGTSSASTDALNYLGINDSVNYTGTNYEGGFSVYDILGSGAGGSHYALTGSVNVNHAGITSAGGYEGIYGTAQGAVNLGGVAGSISPTTYAGSLWGANFYPTLNSGATNWQGLYGVESDTDMSAGSSSAVLVNMLLSQRPNSTVHGTYVDAGMAITGSTSSGGYQDQISFGSPTSDPATSPTGTLIIAQPRRYGWSATLPTEAYAAGIDLRLGSASQAQIEAPGFEDDPNGNTFATSLTTTGSIQAQTAGLASIAVTSGGAYTSVPTLYVQAPPGGGTTATATVTAMGLSSFVPVLSVVSGGTGCSTGDKYTITGGGGAQLTGVATSGAVTTATLATIGSVASPPSNPVSVTGGTCSTEPTFDVAWQILSVTTTPGSGYPMAPFPVVDTSATSYREATFQPTMSPTAATLALNPNGGGVSISAGTISGATIDNAVSTAAGGTTARTLTSHFSDSLNALDYGVSNAGYYNPAAVITVRAGTPTLLNVTGANFNSGNVGNLIFIRGIGANGAELATTISAVNSATQVVLSTAASTFVVNGAESVAYGADQAAAINSFLDSYVGNSALTQHVVFPSGVYIVDSASLNFTLLQNKLVDMTGAVFYGATNGVGVIDGLGIYSTTLKGGTVIGDCLLPPSTGVQIGRYLTGSQAFGRNRLSDLNLNGCFSLTPLYNLMSETTLFDHVQTRDSMASTYGAIFDGSYHFGLTSQYLTVSLPTDTPQTFTLNSIVNSSFVDFGSGGSGVWISNAEGHSWNVADYVSAPQNGFVIWSNSTVRTADVDMRVKIEGGPSTPVNDFYFDGPSTATGSSIVGLKYSTNQNQATGFVFAKNSNLSLKLENFEASMDGLPSGSAVFDSTGNWTPIGHIKFSSTTTITGIPSSFCGAVTDAASDITTQYCLMASGPFYTLPGTAPTSSSGIVDTASYGSTDNHFAITGLSGATTLTVTFSHTWPYKPYCSGGSPGSNPVVATTTTTAAQFTFPSLTGTFQGGCS